MIKEKGLYKNDVKSSVYGQIIINHIAHLMLISLFIIVGVFGIVNSKDYQAMLYVTPILLATYILFIIVFRRWKRVYYDINELLDEKKESELIAIANLLDHKGSMALCALYDLNSTEVKPILLKYQAKAMNMRTDYIGFIKILTNKIMEQESQNDRPLSNEDVQPIIKITKSYFIKDENELGKGMITKIPLTMDSEIVICPFCANMAKKDLLIEWLIENKTCPVCSSELTIDDCPVVDIRDH